MLLRFQVTKDLDKYDSTEVQALWSGAVVNVSTYRGNLLLEHYPDNWEVVTEPLLSFFGYTPFVEQATEPSMNNGDIKLWYNTETGKLFVIWKQVDKVVAVELGTKPPATYHGKLSDADVDGKIATHKAIESAHHEKVTQANVDGKIATEAAKTIHGTVVLASGNTQAQVTHGYSGTPGFVIAIPNQNIGNVWITNIGDTTFTINTSASTGTNTTFYWLIGE